MTTIAADCSDATLFYVPTKPTKHGAEDIKVMDNRQYILEALFMIDGRNSALHSQHHTYTGLLQKYTDPQLSHVST